MIQDKLTESFNKTDLSSDYNLKKPEDRERLLQNIISLISSETDIKTVKSKIVREVGKAFGCNRCFIRMFNLEQDNFIFVDEDSEYLSDIDQKSFIGDRYKENLNKILNVAYKEDKNFILPNLDYLNKFQIPDIDLIKNFLIENDVKSNYCFSVLRNGKLIGTFIIHYTKQETNLSPEEINLANTLAKQIILAVTQYELNLKTRKQAQKEELLRKITETVKYNSNIDEALYAIAKDVAVFFDVQRVSIVEIPDNDPENAIYRAKYRSREDIPLTEEIQHDKKINQYWKEKILDTGIIFAVDNFDNSDIPDYFKETYQKLGTKSLLGAGITNGKNKWGGIGLQAVNNYRIWTQEEIDLLKVIADQIYIAVSQAEMYSKAKKQLEKESLLRKILEALRSSLNFNEVKNNIVCEVGKALNADRCYIRLLQENKTLPIEVEYHSSPDIPDVASYTFEEKLNEFILQTVFNNQLIIVPDTELIDEKNNHYQVMKKFFNVLGTKSNYGFPILNNNELLGTLVVQYTKNKVFLDENSIELLRIIADQAGIALNQANLHLITKKQAERADLLRKITEIIRGSLDINETLTVICDEVAKVFNVQRAAISQVSVPYQDGDFIPRREYKKENTIKGLKEIPLPKEVVVYIGDVILDKGIPLVINNLSESDAPDYFKETYGKMGVKSALCVAIKQDEDKWGSIFLADYDQYRNWTNEEIQLLEAIAGQLYLAIKQAELFDTTKKQAEKEKLLREIIELVRNSLDIKIIKKTIVHELGKSLGVDRAIIIDYYKNTDSFSVIDKDSEYLAAPDIVSMYGFNSNNYDYFKKAFKEGKEFIIQDINEFIKENSLYNTSDEEYIKKYQVKNGLGIPIKYANKVIGRLVLHNTKNSKHFSNDDIEFARTIANQAGVAIYQSKLFNEIKQNAEYERLLREIISLVKGDLDLSSILSLICKKIATVFNVQKTVIIELKGPINESTVFAEYKLSNYKSLKEIEHDSRISLFWEQVMFKRNTPLIVDNLAESDFPDYFKDFYMGINVKSFIAVPIETGNNKRGILILFKYDNLKSWTENEVYFLENISKNISIVIREFHLYSRSNFLSNISHELRTPLAIINGYTEALIEKDKNKSEMAEKFLGIIKSNIDRTNNIINDLLFLSKVENDMEKQNINISKINLNELIKEAIQICQGRADSKNIKLEFISKKVIFSNINKLLMQQALINLIHNAINYSKKRSKVTVCLDKNNEETLISVIDNGIGIEKEHLPYIFDRFYRIDKSRSRKTGGTGLGLSIAKTIAELNGGYITVESEVKAGSIFTIHLLS